MKNEHEFDRNDVFSYVLILHLNSTLFIWKKATINSIIVYSYYTWYLLDRIVFKLLLYYLEIDVSSFGGEINWISALDLSIDFFICNIGIRLEI